MNTTSNKLYWSLFPLFVLVATLLLSACVPATRPRPTPTPAQTATITGRVMDVALSARVITLAESVQGISAVALTDGTEIVSADGASKTLSDVRSGIVIEATGSVTSPGALLAQKVRLLTEVTATPAPATGFIDGRVWHDLCAIAGGEGGVPATPSYGCVETDEGVYQANGILEGGEPGIEGVLVTLGTGACPSAGLSSTTTDADGAYVFTGLRAGTYCVSVNSLHEQNVDVLIPGSWTYPAGDAASDVANTTVTLATGEDKQKVNFGWDYQFLPAPGTKFPTPTVTFTPTQPGADNTATVTTAALNIRRRPDTAYPVITTVQRGDTLTVTGQDATGAWLRVWLSEGMEGWVSRGFTDFRDSAPVVSAPPLPPTPTPPLITAWRGEYYDSPDLTGAPRLVRNEATVNFNWGRSAPANGLPSDNFSARWTRIADFDAATYRFHIIVDDGARLWIDDRLIIDEWRAGSAREVTADVPLTRGAHRLRVEYYEEAVDARIRVWWEKVATVSFPDWKSEYWANRYLSGNPTLVTNNKAINFYWGEGAPASGVPADNFSVRWSRQVTFESDVYRFYTQADDGIRIYLDGNLVLNEWHDSSGQGVYVVDLTLAGTHWLVVEYYDNAGAALAKFWWERLSAQPTATLTWTPTVTPTMTPTPTTAPTSTPAATPTPVPTNTPTLVPTDTPTPVPTDTPEPTETPTPESTETPTPVPTDTPVVSPTPTETPVPFAGVWLNEVLPAPGRVDWDGNGTATQLDEWIELYNTGPAAVDLSGWFLDDGPRGSKPYRIPAGMILKSGSFAVFYRRKTNIELDNSGDQVRLIKADGTVLDEVTFGALGFDTSYSRDEAGTWHANWPPSPGAPNLPPPVEFKSNPPRPQ